MKIVPMEVEYKYHSGDDLMVVNAARVSMHKESEWEYGEWLEDAQGIYMDMVLSDKDAKLISYLAKHGHWTPFSHNAITLRIKAPIFVARQLFKHKIGFTENEVSRRYVDDEPEFYLPDVWRARADNVKQGSSSNAANITVPGSYEAACMTALSCYKSMIDDGVAPEQARMVLPQSMMTEWYWTGSLAAYARMCKLRLDPHAQKETQEIAQMISDIIAPLFPVSWKALSA